jgi:hypothetical protein
MNVGMDIGGTISEMPELMAILAEGLRARGHKVYILSLENTLATVETEQYLKDHGIAHDGLFLLPGGTIDAWEWKPRMAAVLHLDVMIDDSPELLARMPDGVKRIGICHPETWDLGRLMED